MNHTDNCPDCSHRGIAPHSEHDDGERILSHYRCPRCGATWTCSRLADAYPPQYRAPGQSAA